MASDRTTTPAELLQAWIHHRNPTSALWLWDAAAKTESGDFRAFSLAFSLASRKVGKDDLALSQTEWMAASQARPGWDPSSWTMDQSARTLLVLSLPSSDETSYRQSLDKVFAAADVGELVALYQSLPILPHPQAHALRAAEGIRTNMRAVFEAVAHRNPYPSEQLDESAWNQMILKCLFIGTTLGPVVGIDDRANPALARMLWDYSKERRAAKRTVSPELWRCVGPFATDEIVTELARLLASGDEMEKKAAALALTSCPLPQAKASLDQSELKQDLLDGKWRWNDVIPPT